MRDSSTISCVPGSTVFRKFSLMNMFLSSFHSHVSRIESPLRGIILVLFLHSFESCLFGPVHMDREAANKQLGERSEGEKENQQFDLTDAARGRR